eukprot:535785-Pelagomonas_calceolata.AAC.6
MEWSSSCFRTLQHTFCACTQAKSLSAAVASLQVASCQAGDSEAAGLRTKVTQLEALLRTRDKELERARCGHGIFNFSKDG